MSRAYHQYHHAVSARPAIVVNVHDVLSGRGVNIALHPGNERFRSLVTTRADPSYCTSYSASEKRAVAEEIIKHIKSLDPPGRFLRREGRGHKFRGLNGPWEELSDRESIKKTCQALRDCNRQDRAGYAMGVVPPTDVAVSAETLARSGMNPKQHAAAAAAASAAASAASLAIAADATLKNVHHAAAVAAAVGGQEDVNAQVPPPAPQNLPQYHHHLQQVPPLHQQPQQHHQLNHHHPQALPPQALPHYPPAQAQHVGANGLGSGNGNDNENGNDSGNGYGYGYGKSNSKVRGRISPSVESAVEWLKKQRTTADGGSVGIAAVGGLGMGKGTESINVAVGIGPDSKTMQPRSPSDHHLLQHTPSLTLDHHLHQQHPQHRPHLLPPVQQSERSNRNSHEAKLKLEDNTADLSPPPQGLAVAPGMPPSTMTMNGGTNSYHQYHHHYDQYSSTAAVHAQMPSWPDQEQQAALHSLAPGGPAHQHLQPAPASALSQPSIYHHHPPLFSPGMLTMPEDPSEAGGGTGTLNITEL